MGVEFLVVCYWVGCGVVDGFLYGLLVFFCLVW